MTTSLAVLGDDARADRMRAALAGRSAPFAIGVVTPDGARLAGAGSDRDAGFEIGSVSKGVTGLLYVDALERGEVGADTTLADVLPVAATPLAGVRLSDLATHRSRLPRSAPGTPVVRGSIDLVRHGTNPYGESLDQLLAQAPAVEFRRSSRPHYSNFGFALLGHAVAAAAGTTYADLIRTRVADPLGLDVFYCPATPAELRPASVRGHGRGGRVREPWTGEAIAPAGGIRASLPAMVRLLTALLDGTAPGRAALDPVADLGRGARIGAAWITVELRGRRITWHNGGTGGFRSWIGLDREAGVGAVVLSARSVSVDRAGFSLLTP
ncbi:serine hydrolase domain-containing protein [Sporichthya polymorpha]|uniref:serine hydrolase domain-containing protein n=1 Tax=Sporichthya polymorpha TaxID=35751 RepID=UPI0003666857|nr:serine hydrolase domain-containing protein [Sporichthya polymorpha]